MDNVASRSDRSSGVIEADIPQRSQVDDKSLSLSQTVRVAKKNGAARKRAAHSCCSPPDLIGRGARRRDRIVDVFQRKVFALLELVDQPIDLLDLLVVARLC